MRWTASQLLDHAFVKVWPIAEIVLLRVKHLSLVLHLAPEIWKLKYKILIPQMDKNYQIWIRQDTEWDFKETRIALVLENVWSARPCRRIKSCDVMETDVTCRVKEDLELEPWSL